MTKKSTAEEFLVKAKKPAKLSSAYYPSMKEKFKLCPTVPYAVPTRAHMYAHDVSTVYKAITNFEAKI